jgi:hypothetical protein
VLRPTTAQNRPSVPWWSHARFGAAIALKKAHIHRAYWSASYRLVASNSGPLPSSSRRCFIFPNPKRWNWSHPLPAKQIPNSYINRSFLIDREAFALSEDIVQDFSIDPVKVLKPMFDFVWNACGFEESRNFDKDGKWVEGRY